MSELRKCRVCGEEKESTEFRSPKQGTICLACSKKRTQEWQAANRDKMRANNKKYVDSIKSGERERREKIPEGHKRCPKCKEIKPFSEFGANRVYCRDCKADKLWEYRQKHPSDKPYTRRKVYTKARESEFIGMPFQTANHRLRASILFSLVVRCGDDICFRCGEKITNPKDLSVEHKKEWMGESVALFWDLDNIAFSHRSCNVNRHCLARKKRKKAVH